MSDQQIGPEPTDLPSAPPEPPRAAWPPLPTSQEAPVSIGYYFLSPAPASRWAIGFLIAYGVIDIITAGSEFLSMSQNADFTMAIITGGLDIIQLIISIPCAVFFLIWVYRVCSNAIALGAGGLSASPGWAVGYFFIPILNFFRPYEAMRDTWQASTPGLDLHSNSESWRGMSTGAIVGWWWAWWIVQIMASLATMIMGIANIAAFEQSMGPGLSDLLHVVVTAVAIRFVLALTSRQEEAYRRLIASASGR